MNNDEGRSVCSGLVPVRSVCALAGQRCVCVCVCVRERERLTVFVFTLSLVLVWFALSVIWRLPHDVPNAESFEKYKSTDFR